VTPDLEALFAGCRPAGIVTVAVSGGGDSLALLLLVDAWSRKRGIDLHAVTVDHGLRPQSAAEAAFVAETCAGLRIDHSTLLWSGRKPAAGLPGAAREARYRLIEAHARAIGSDLVLVAHTADDQAETALMRLRRRRQGGSGRGLAAMERFSRLPGGTLLCRPLLGVSRAALRDYLAFAGQVWIEDPTNRDLAYERVRVRRLLETDPQLSLQMTAFAAAMARWRAITATDAANLLSRVAASPGPVYELPATVLDSAPAPAALLALRTLAALAGGGNHLPAAAALEAMIGRPQDRRCTAGGALVERRGATIRTWREARNVPTMAIAPGMGALWDGRLEIGNDSPGELVVMPLGELSGGSLGSEGGRPRVKPAAALAATPVIAGGQDAWLPLAGVGSRPDGVSVRLVCPAIEYFCPASEFPLAGFVARMRTALNAQAPAG
jgi:tRNA(Ile)-lysidine synthase